MLNTLTDLGRVDVAYTIVNQKDFPGWGHMLESGATTLWEHWEFSDNTYSHNHPMFGSVSEWFFKAIAGINPLPEAVGFDKVMIRPHVVGDLTWAKGDYNSVRGHVVCNWRVEGESLLVDVAIPAGVTAAVHLPAKDPKTVTEGGQPIGKAEGVEVVSEAEGLVICKVGSGEYKFAIGRFVRSGQ
jgi:alpha-L-rhamnosidase